MKYRIITALLCCVLWVPGSLAATPLTLGEAIARVLEHNPRLQAADYDARAAAQRIRQQEQAPPMDLGLDVGNIGLGGNRLETTLSLGRVLELGDKAGKRGVVATLEAGLLRHEQDAQRLDLLVEVARRFLAIMRVQHERDLAEQRVELIQGTLNAVQRRHAVGKAAAAEVNRVQIDLVRAELGLEESEQRLNNGRRALAVLWGAFEPDFEQVQASLFKLEAVPAFATLDARIEANPDLVRLATLQRLGKARQQLAQARVRSNLEWQAGLRHFNDTDDLALQFSVRVPLGSRRRAEAYITEAEALAAREPLLANEQRLALRNTLSSLHQEMRHARQRYAAYQSRILPAAEQALTEYSQGYASGRYTLVELNSMQQTLLDSHHEILLAAIDHHAARIEIERLIGGIPHIGANQ
ncbi:MAG: TolC family protein [Thiohalomonadaceae bacterium]